jgi:hypothetical protein
MAQGVGGCHSLEPRELQLCEATLKAKLKAPSSYKRVSTDTTYMKDQNPPQVWVSIEYDAVNSFNAPLRDREICMYPANKGGGVDWVQYEKAQDEETRRLLAPPLPLPDPATANKTAEEELRKADAAAAAADKAAAAAFAASSQADAEERDASNLPTGSDRFPYKTPDGVDITNARDEANWKKYGTTDPNGGE